MKELIVRFWQIFKKTPVGWLLRKLSPQWLVNLLEHLPLAILANIIYGFPSRGLKVIGVTGTDGKTTTTNMIYQILEEANLKVSMISTIKAVIGRKVYDTGFHVTNPSPFELQKYLSEAKKAGSKYFILEVTSHGLDQFRVWGIKFDVGVITNITHEHLDYHKNFENYLKSKAKLIRNVKVAVLNHDEEHFTKLSKQTNGKVVSFGLHKSANFNPQKFSLDLKVPGDFNILNAESAACAISLGISSQIVKRALNNFSNLSGRMEEIENDLGFRIVVDFAHTPNGLENVLTTLKKQTKHKLISVFGAASERDDAKRPLMGEISAKIADITILTDEDPRFEDSNKILEEIAKGAYQAGAKDGETLFKEPDRSKAIILALNLAKRGDTIGIFGKGHETSMSYFGIERPWSDKEAVIKALHGF